MAFVPCHYPHSLLHQVSTPSSSINVGMSRLLSSVPFSSPPAHCCSVAYVGTRRFVAFILTSRWCSILVYLMHIWPLSGASLSITSVEPWLICSQTCSCCLPRPVTDFSLLSENMWRLFICSGLLCGFFQECLKVSAYRFCMFPIKHSPSYFILSDYYM